jgi:hypothetical protein
MHTLRVNVIQTLAPSETGLRNTDYSINGPCQYAGRGDRRTAEDRSRWLAELGPVLAAPRRGYQPLRRTRLQSLYRRVIHEPIPQVADDSAQHSTQASGASIGRQTRLSDRGRLRRQQAVDSPPTKLASRKTCPMKIPARVRHARHPMLRPVRAENPIRAAHATSRYS